MDHLLEALESSLEEMKILRGRVNDLQAKTCTEIYDLTKKIVEAGGAEASESFLKEVLAENRDLVIIHYYLALLEYLTGDNGDHHLANFFTALQKVGKTQLIEGISLQILSYYQSQYVYSTMAQQAERAGDETQLIKILSKLIELDPSDVVIAKRLAKLHVSHDLSIAVHYYEQAMNSSFDASDFGEAMNIWGQLVKIVPEEVDLLIAWAKKISQHVSSEQTYELFITLLKRQEGIPSDSKVAIIKILKASLDLGVVLQSQFFLILHAYREVYAEHPYLNDFLMLSGLVKLVKSKKANKSAELLLTYIHQFEKLIKLDHGRFVSHKSFGLGMIQRFKKLTALPGMAPSPLKLICDFEKKRGHEMSLEIAAKSLTLCYEKHIVALKLFKKEEFAELMAGDPMSFAKEVLKTLERPATSKEIHDLLVPRIFAQSDWAAQWRELKKNFSTSTEVDFNGKAYVLLEEGSDPVTRTLQALKQTTKADEKLRIMDTYLAYQKTVPSDIFDKFIEELRALAGERRELQLLASALAGLVAERSTSTNPPNAPSLPNELVFEKVYESLGSDRSDNLTTTTTATEEPTSRSGFIHSFNFALNQQQRHLLLKNLRGTLGKTRMIEELSGLLIEVDIRHRELIFEEFLKQADRDSLKKTCRRISEQYLEHREAFVIVALYLLSNDPKETIEIRDLLLYKMVRLLTELHRLISIEKDLALSKRLHTSLMRILFEQEVLMDYMDAHVLSEKDASPLDETKWERIEKMFKELNQQAFHPEPLKIRLRAIQEKVRQRTRPVSE